MPPGDRNSGSVAAADRTMHAIEINNVAVDFPVPGRGDGARRRACHSMTFTVPRDGFVSLVGPSGCGKSTLLNVCAGILEPAEGGIRLRDEAGNPLTERIGYITQDANLLPWMTVLDNVALPLKLQGMSAKSRRDRAMDWVTRVGLEEFSKHYPAQLSGGMQKRCSIARTMVYDPSILLMDEPFGALDAMTKLVLQQELLDILARDRKSVLFVTHDLAEAIALSDQVVVMSRGPGTLKALIDVPLPRPREVGEITTDPEFGHIFKQLWDTFKEELR